MTRSLGPLTLLIALLIGNGCGRALMNISTSVFLSNFSLEDLVKKNHSFSGKICAGNGLGGIGGGGGSSFREKQLGRKQSSSNLSSSFSCQINSGGDYTFDEAAFLASLKSDVETEIGNSGAKVTGQGSSGPQEFYFEYVEHDLHGRVEISGRKSAASF